MFIGISQRLEKAVNYNEIREALSIEWGEFFALNLTPFLPLPLCVKMPLKSYEKNLKGVILSGGNDLSKFNKNAENSLRDSFENELLKFCIENKTPLLAVCRGAQFVAEFFGSKLEICDNHIGEHEIYDEKGVKFRVNSFHKYKITHLGEDLKCLATAQDKSIEGFCHKSLPIFAMMWHIERKNGLENRAILTKFKGEILK